jgi:hypothetical protein
LSPRQVHIFESYTKRRIFWYPSWTFWEKNVPIPAFSNSKKAKIWGAPIVHCTITHLLYLFNTLKSFFYSFHNYKSAWRVACAWGPSLARWYGLDTGNCSSRIQTRIQCWHIFH